MVLNGVVEVANSEATDSSTSNEDHMFVGSKTKKLLNDDKISSATVCEGFAKRPPYLRRRVVSSGDQLQNPKKRPSLKDAFAESAEDGAWRSRSMPGAFPMCLREDQFDPREEHRLIAGHRADTGPQPGVLAPSQPTDQSQARQVRGSSNQVTLGSKLDSSDTGDRRSPERFQTLRNDEWPTVIRDSEMNSSEASDFSSSEPLDTPLLPIFNPESTTAPSHRSLRFQAYHQEAISARVVAHSIFAVMKNQLKGKADLGEGRIYSLYMPDHPGFIKIGRTTQAIMKRRDQIQRCVEFKLHSANDDDHCPIPNHGRVENLIHAELRNYRRCFTCAVCKQKPKLEERKGEKPREKRHDCDGLKIHGEWFEIDQAKAFKVIGRWKDWISMAPYCDGALRPREQLRINYYASNARRMKRMETMAGEDWRWDEFMTFPEWRYWCSWTRHEFFRERLETSSRSRFDSLCKHWQSNVLFCLGFFGAEVFRSVFPSGLAFAFCYSVVISFMGVLYTA